MDASQIVANCLPFLMAYILQFLKVQMRLLAENTLKILAGDGVEITGVPKEIAIKLALHFYKQLSFMLSVLLSTVSALALTLGSKRPLVGVLVAFSLLVLVAVWLLRWQTLGTGDAAQRERLDKEMSAAAYANTTLMLAATIAARWV